MMCFLAHVVVLLNTSRCVLKFHCKHCVTTRHLLCLTYLVVLFNTSYLQCMMNSDQSRSQEFETRGAKEILDKCTDKMLAMY